MGQRPRLLHIICCTQDITIGPLPVHSLIICILPIGRTRVKTARDSEAEHKIFV